MSGQKNKPSLKNGTNPKNGRRTWSNWMPVGIGLVSIVLLVGAIGGWAVTANISGAIIGSGQIQIAANRQALQHPVGGVVSQIMVENGDSVNAGDVVLRLDETQSLSELKIIEGELYELLSKEARLEAEIDETTEMSLHPLLQKAASEDPGINKLVVRQRRHLKTRLGALDTNARLLRQQIDQVRKQIVGVEAELDTKSMRRGVVEKELSESQSLLEQGLTKRSTMRGLEKDQFTTQGDIGKLTAKVAELKGKISELELKLHALGPTNQEKAIEELGKLRPLKTKFLEKRLAVLDLMSKLEIRTPISGTIHDTKIEGLRSVVVAAKPLMYVVPRNKPISVAVKINAADIDQVHFGQEATLRFTSFNRRNTPMIQGKVTKISADAFLEPVKKKFYYEIEIALAAVEVDRLGDRALIPGMPVEAFIATESRSPLTYVTKPFMDYFNRAFRDA